MKAVILVGGEGTRLRPLTCNRPKPMIPVVNRPFLEHVLGYLKQHGIFDIVLSMGYKPDVIQEYFGDGREFGVNLTYVVETSPLGTAGGVKNVEEYIDGTCFVFNGDILTDLDLRAMLEAHRAKNALVSIALTPVENPTSYGLVETDGDLRVLRFVEKPSWDKVTTNLINAGTYVLEPEALRYVPPNEYYMFEHGLFPTLLKEGELVYGFPSDCYWIDIGTPEKYIKVHRDVLAGKVRLDMPGKFLKDGIRVGADCEIAPTVSFLPPVIIGDRVAIGAGSEIIGPAVIGSDCTIGSGTRIEDAVIWQGTSIGNRVTMNSCVVARDCAIQDDVRLADGAIIADNCTIGTGNRLERGIKVWPGKSIEPSAITF